MEDSDATLSKHKDKSMCVLGTLNAIPFDRQIYIYLKMQKLSGDFGNLKSEVWSLKFQLAEWLTKNSYAEFQSICHNKNNSNNIQNGSQKTHKT